MSSASSARATSARADSSNTTVPTASSSPRPRSTAGLTRYGWDARWAAEHAPYAERGLVPGRVVRVDRGRCDIVTATGDLVRADTTYVTPHDPLRVICTGDWAVFEPGDPHYVREYLPRRTSLVRSTSSKRSEGQILAANVDHVVITISLGVELELGRIERYLALAWESGAVPLIVLTKCDLVPDPVVLGHLVEDVGTTAPGAQVLPVSAGTGEGMDTLTAVLLSGTAVLLGASGAGKSTLANSLLGAEVMGVQAVRDMDGKGRHTTTTRNLFVLPNGGVLIDTPGLRGVGLWDAEAGVGQVFAEIEELAERCRFPDCAHMAEPGCAILAAVDKGELPLRRLESYRKLLRENQYIAAKTDARMRAEIRRDRKLKGAQGKAAGEAKRAGRIR